MNTIWQRVQILQLVHIHTNTYGRLYPKQLYSSLKNRKESVMRAVIRLQEITEPNLQQRSN